MLVRTDIPNLLLAGMKKEFMKQLKMHVPEWNRVASQIKSGKATETYPWLGGVPDLREWKDERVTEGLNELEFAIKNYDWEGTIAVDRNAIDDEQYGQIGIRVRDLADKARRFWGRLALRRCHRASQPYWRASACLSALSVARVVATLMSG